MIFCPERDTTQERQDQLAQQAETLKPAPTRGPLSRRPL